MKRIVVQTKRWFMVFSRKLIDCNKDLNELTYVIVYEVVVCRVWEKEEEYNLVMMRNQS